MSVLGGDSYCHLVFMVNLMDVMVEEGMVEGAVAKIECHIFNHSTENKLTKQLYAGWNTLNCQVKKKWLICNPERGIEDWSDDMSIYKIKEDSSPVEFVPGFFVIFILPRPRVR